MSLERKDVRFKVAAEMHQALTVLAEVSQVDIGEFVETLVVREVAKRVHEASVIHERTARLGIAGNVREFPGAPGKHQE
jgi:hypothetical protein